MEILVANKTYQIGSSYKDYYKLQKKYLINELFLENFDGK